MKGLLTIACNTFLRQGKLFPTSFASVWVTKSIILSQKVQKTNVRLLSDCARIRPWIEIKSQHVTAVLWKQELQEFLLQSGGQKIENSSQTNDFDFENLSSLSSIVRRLIINIAQDHMTFGVSTGNRSKACDRFKTDRPCDRLKVALAYCHEF